MNILLPFLLGILKLSSAFSVANPNPGRAVDASASGKAVVEPIPVTVLSGFLGSGKTTLLQHLLNNNEGLRIAVVVNDVAAVNVDAKLVSNQNDAAGIVELQNGCACCSRSEELLASVAQLVSLSDTRSKDEAFQHIVIEMSGVADPRSVRSKFQEAVLYDMRKFRQAVLFSNKIAISPHSPALIQRAYLDTMVTVVDCGVFLDYMKSDQVATAETTPELFYRDEDEANDNRQWLNDDDLPPGLLEAVFAGEKAASNTVVDLLVSQTEIADIVLLNKEDLVENAEKLKQIKSIVSALNPRGEVVQSSFGKIPLRSVLGVAKGMGVVEAGVIDDHKDAVEAALLAHDPNCADPDCSHDSHAHSHDHSPDGNEPGHDHQHSHRHKSEGVVSTDPGNAEAHEHSHNHAYKEDSICVDPGCTENHEHSHAHASTDHAGIGTYVYNSRRPFHPSRLLAFLRNLPITHGLPEKRDGEDSLELSPEAQSAMKNVLRSKGFIWCADSHEAARYWSHAGISFELTMLGKWWATLPRDQWPEGASEAILSDFDDHGHDDAVKTCAGTVGDRRQELVLIGPGIGEVKAQNEISALLDKCLLDDEELEVYRQQRSDEKTLASTFENSIDARVPLF